MNQEIKKRGEYEIVGDEYIHTGLDKITSAGLLSDSNLKQMADISKELAEAWHTDKIWRTETEMRYSVLEDVKFPTRGMKYLQARTEQNVHFTNLMYLSCDYDEEQGMLIVAESELETLEGRKETKRTEGLILQKKAAINRHRFRLMEMDKQGHHRVREVATWEKIKKELDDGSFDTTDYDGIQAEGLPIRWANQIQAKSEAPNAHNIVGQLSAFQSKKS